jgi:hypothetical protein
MPAKPRAQSTMAMLGAASHGQGCAPLDPRKVLTAIGEAVYDWDLARPRAITRPTRRRCWPCRGGALEREARAWPLLRPLRRGQGARYRPAFAGSPSHEMIEALNSRRIAFAAQPVVEAQSRAVAFREALMRIRTDDRLVSAGAILPAIERTGLMPLVDARMLELVADHLAGHGEWASITCRGGIAARRCWPATKASRRRGTRPEDAISVTAPRASPACRPSDA